MKKVNIEELPQIKLSYKQKLILRVLKDEFAGSAFGPEMLAETENEDLKKLTINEVTWHILRLREDGLVTSVKENYQGRMLNRYTTTPIVDLNCVEIK